MQTVTRCREDRPHALLGNSLPGVRVSETNVAFPGRHHSPCPPVIVAPRSIISQTVRIVRTQDIHDRAHKSHNALKFYSGTVECETGYTVSGPFQCVAGNLSSETCVPNDCDMNFGDCTGTLSHGQSCVPTTGCTNSSYTISGQIRCEAGRLVENVTCSVPSCNIEESPMNGAMGSCTSTLASGSSCLFQCDNTYSVSSPTSCHFGTLTQIGTCIRNCSSIDDTVTNIPFRFSSSNEQKAFVSRDDTLTVLHSKENIPVRVTIPTSSFVSSDITISTTPNRATTVKTVLHRDVVYITDRTIKISHQAYDHLSRTTIDQNDLSIDIVLRQTVSSEVISSCDVSRSSCSESVPTSWFSSSSDSTIQVLIRYVYTSGSGTSSTIFSLEHDVTLVKIPVHDTLSGAGVWFELPTHSVYPQESLTISLYANTEAHTLATWNLVLQYDHSVLSYVETNEASPYSITSGTSTQGQVNMLGSSPMDTSNSLITGSSIHLGDVVFNVLAAGASSTTSISGNAIQMTTKSSFVFVSNEPCQINDHAGSSSVEGSIQISSNDLVGLISTSSTHDVLNLAQLDGSRRSFDINVMGIYSRQGEVSISSGLTCSSDSTSTLQVESDCSSLYVDGT